MALIFIGRVNEMGRQNFRSGIMRVRGLPRKVRETQYVPVLDDDGKPVLTADGGELRQAVEVEVDRVQEWKLTTMDIDQAIDCGEDETYLLATYPNHFRQA